jgi:E3 ubiquitin-protein ligase DOA10
VMPICHHEFHRDCIANWFVVARNNTCPLCRAKLQWSLVAQDMV